jgi:hypothetical protein
LSNPPDTRTRIERRPRHPAARTALDLAVSLPSMWTERQMVRDAMAAESFLFFVGYPRSGSTLVGALLTAHPEIAVSLEIDVLRRARWGFTRRQLLALVARRHREWYEQGLRWSGYDYEVEGQWQHGYRTLRVVGDKKAASTSLAVHARPELVDVVRRRMGKPLRVVHVVRSPWDTISTMSRRSGSPVEKVIVTYERMASGVAITRDALRSDDAIVDLHLEALVEDPRAELTSVCAVLDVTPDQSWLDACAALVFDRPKQTRESVTWSPAHSAAVDALIARFDWLARYAREDPDVPR